MRARLVASLLLLLAIVAPAVAPAQLAPTDPLTPAERPIVESAVQDVYDSYRRSRRSNGVGNVIGATVTGGLGAYLYVVGTNEVDPQNAVTLQVIGIGVMLSAVPQLVSGVWNIFYDTPQEDIAARLLNDERLLDNAGVLFLEQEARRAKRQRLVGGTTSIVQGLAILGSYALYAQVFGSIDILLIFFGVAAAIQTIGGVVDLVGLSPPERAYRQVLRDLGRSEPVVPMEDNRVSRLRFAPTLLSNEGKLAPGAGFGLSF